MYLPERQKRGRVIDNPRLQVWCIGVCHMLAGQLVRDRKWLGKVWSRKLQTFSQVLCHFWSDALINDLVLFEESKVRKIG